MESIFLDGFKSPIAVGQTVKFLEALHAGNLGQQILVDGKPAMVTAVHDNTGKVFMLSLNNSVVGGSIPVDDPHDEPIGRSPEYFRSPLLDRKDYGRAIGIAAYKFIDAPGVVTRRTAQVSETID